VPPEIAIPLFMRWIHIFSAMVLIGGTMFIFAILLPVLAKTGTPEERVKLRDTLMRRWKLFSHVGIVLIFATGIYNLMSVIGTKTDGEPAIGSFYILLFCAKFALALAVFALVFIGTSTMKWSESLRERKGLWWFLVAASIAVVLVANIMKFVSHQAS
jgi:uncharacterized membrane protein